jgi:hypothetical protein
MSTLTTNSLADAAPDLLRELKRMVRCAERGHELGEAAGKMALKACTEMAKLAIAEAERLMPEPAEAVEAESITTTQAPAVDDEPPATTRGDPASAETWATPTQEEQWLSIEGFHSGGQWIAARKPIMLRVSPHQRCASMHVDNCEPFYLCAGGSTDEELQKMIEEEFDILWRNYALEDDARFTGEARKLKADLLAAFVVDGAA